MDVRHFLLPCALRRFSALVIAAVVAALLPVVALAAPAQAAAGDPGGNNGTVKVQEVDFDDPPNNDPHVGCTFLLEWYGFDKGADIISKVTFEMQAPTDSVGLTVNGPSQVFVGGDAASGAGTATGLDGRQEYTLAFDGPPHPVQGYHVKLTINTPGSKGADKKYKVFWVKGCDPVVTPAPAIDLDKTVADSPSDNDSVGSLGEVLTYTFKVTNTGNVKLTNVVIDDPQLGLDGYPCAANLAVGASATCTATYTVTAADIAAGKVHNTATASGNPPTGPPVEDEDDVEYPTPAKPSISVEKTVADSGDNGKFADLGEQLTYTFVVKNTGNVPLTGVVIDDTKLGLTAEVCGKSTLAVGESVTCTRTYTVTAGDVAHGSVDNTVTATGTPPTGDDVTDEDSADIPTKKNPPAAGINLDKTVADSSDADSVGSLGEVLTYTFKVTNTGDVALTDVVIDDPQLELNDFPCAANLAVGASATCTTTYTVTAADIAAGEVHNTATASGNPPTGPPVEDEDKVKIHTPAKPSISVDKTVADSPSDTDTMASLGEVLTYTFVVKNTGNVPLTGVVLDDTKLGLTNSVCDKTSLAVGESVTCTRTYTVTAADVTHGSVDNTVTAKGTPPTGGPVTDKDSADIPTKAPVASIFLDKTVADSPSDGDSVGSLGEVLTYTFKVTNTGNVTLENVTISDPMFSLTNAPCVATLAPGETTSCPDLPQQSHTVTAADVEAGMVVNQATTSGKPPTGPPVSDADDAKMLVPNGKQDDADLVVEKTANVSVAAPGDTVTYTVRVRNTGAGDAANVVVTDTLPAGTTYVSSSAPCTYSSPTVTCALGTIEAGDDREVTITVKVNAAGNGDTSHAHHLDYTKVESHVSLFDDDTKTETASCPQGYLATDGSVRLDHVDHGTGTFEDAVVLASGVSADGRGWTGTIRNDATGQVQAKINVVCMTEKTTSGEDHSHAVVVTGPVSASQAFAAGRHDVDLVCAPGSYAIRPSFAFTSGEGVVTSRRTATGWRFTVDTDGAAQGTFSVHCLSSSLGTASGHTHDLKFEELTDSVTVPAGQVVETRLTCRGDYKGIVAWVDMDPGLVSLGHDPQPVTRVFRFYNPTGSALTARFGLLCVAIRTNGGNQGDSEVKNTASASTSSPESDTSDNTSSVTVAVNPTGVAVSPKASVAQSGGGTVVRLALTAGSARSVTLKLVAAGKVRGTRLGAGSVLASGKRQLKAGQVTVPIAATKAAAQALRSGKIGKAKIVLVTKNGHRDVRIVKLKS